MTNDIESILVSEQQIDEITTRIANEINSFYKNSEKKLVFICILKGSLMFSCELMKKITLPIEIDFMKVSSYGAKTVSSGVINIHLDIKRDDMADVDFIIIEDIVDSGKTLSHLVRYLAERGANSVKTCTLLDKPSRRTVDFTPDWCGMEIPDKFVVGFGLDYNEKYRNLPYVGVLKPEVYSK
ncbi:MAG: hypoxanthine phosphoribosyltransferase [Ruminococcaceae bacterium]|nr:hypoxanthine phosphoribosyltransferase [Oscillospiraceae bacterium]